LPRQAPLDDALSSEAQSQQARIEPSNDPPRLEDPQLSAVPKTPLADIAQSQPNAIDIHSNASQSPDLQAASDLELQQPCVYKLGLSAHGQDSPAPHKDSSPIDPSYLDVIVPPAEDNIYE
jgi:hypothetical protein